MFCSKCGKQLADYANFCPGCGAAVEKLELTSEGKTENIKDVKPSKSNNKRNPRRKFTKVMVILASIVAFCLLSLFIFIKWTNSIVIEAVIPSPEHYFGIPFKITNDNGVTRYESIELDRKPSDMITSYTSLLRSEYGFASDFLGKWDSEKYKITMTDLEYENLGRLYKLVDRIVNLDTPKITVEMLQKHDSEIYKISITHYSNITPFPAETYAE